MEKNGENKTAQSREYIEKPKRRLLANRFDNILHSLRLRDIGFDMTNGAIAEHYELLAETSFIQRDFEEAGWRLPGPARATYLVVFSPDGRKVASTHGNHCIYVTDARTGENIETLTGHPRTPWCVTFHPRSNDILASGCLGGQVRVWNLNGGSQVWCNPNQSVISSLAFHPIENLLVFATETKIYFWKWSEREPFAITRTMMGDEKVRYVAFDKSGEKFITGIQNSPDAGRMGPMLSRTEAGCTSGGDDGSEENGPSTSTGCKKMMLESIGIPPQVLRLAFVSEKRSEAPLDDGNHPLDRDSAPNPDYASSYLLEHPSNQRQVYVPGSYVQRLMSRRSIIQASLWDAPEPLLREDIVSRISKALIMEQMRGRLLVNMTPAHMKSIKYDITHRIQAWDFSKAEIPVVVNPQENVVVEKCIIHNDATIELSSDGKLLFALLPPTDQCIRVSTIGGYSLKWKSLGVKKYSAKIDETVVSLSLSPTQRHLLIGTATRRIFNNNDSVGPMTTMTMGLIYKLVKPTTEQQDPRESDEKYNGRKKVGTAGTSIIFLRELKHSRLRATSINCMRWVPHAGQGIVYGTTCGQLRVLH